MNPVELLTDAQKKAMGEKRKRCQNCCRLTYDWSTCGGITLCWTCERIIKNTCPECMRDDDKHEEWCSIGRTWRLNAVVAIAVACLGLWGCASSPGVKQVVSDYRSGKPNALVCPDNAPCFECDHATAKRYAELWQQGKWYGGIVYLPLSEEP